MINILYEEYPTAICIEEKEYPIYTDFRAWLKFYDMIDDLEISSHEKVSLALGWFKEVIPKDIEQAYSKLISFARCEDLIYSKSCGSSNNAFTQILSYKYDCEYILSAFLQVYNINLRNVEYLHWYEFKALFNGLPEDAPIKKRMTYRSINLADIKDKEEKQRILKIKRDLAFPTKPLTARDIGNVFD